MNRNGIDDQINDNNTDEPQDILEENVDNYDQKKLIIFPVYYDIKKNCCEKYQNNVLYLQFCL